MGAYCVISDDKCTLAKADIEKLKAAVFVHLFYEEQVAFYREYLRKIPGFVDVIIISPKNMILECFDDNEFIKIKKENRGRDISALLVEAKKLVFHYEYVCFIHDKKEKDPNLKEFTDAWIRNLWDNMLQSRLYIYNVLELMKKDRRLGMLVPLPPYGKDRGIWLKGCWGQNYMNTKSLADELGLKVSICCEKPPVSYSTVFWARSEALRKLFSKNWSYEDFPNEPMEDDGEINHAIERILEYVARDAGYEVKIALSSSFAASFIEQLHEELSGLWNRLGRELGINDSDGLDHYNLRVKKIRDFSKCHKDIYLYGDGKRGRECLAVCRLLEIIPRGFIVTNPENVHRQIEGIPVFSVSDVALNGDAGIIVSVGRGFQEEIEGELGKRDFEEYIIF